MIEQPPAAGSLSVEERRRRLHRLDSLLDRLEFVNEHGLDELPDTLVAALHAVGIGCNRLTSATALIEAVWRKQEPLLAPPSARVRPRRVMLDALDYGVRRPATRNAWGETVFDTPWSWRLGTRSA